MTTTTVLLIAIVGTLNIACFFVGAMVGQKVSKGEKIEAPNPIRAIEERRERKEARKELEQFDVIMQNLDAYNGTSIGQKEVPKR